MAVACTAIANGTGQSTSASTVATGSIAPVANNGYLAWVVSRAAASPPIPTVAGCGLTWVQIATRVDATNFRRITVFRALKTSGVTSGAVTATFSGSQTVALISVLELSGDIDKSGTDGSGFVVTSAQNGATGSVGGSNAFVSLTMAAWGDSVNNAAVAGFWHGNAEVSTPDAAWTEKTDQAGISSTCLETQFKVGQDTTATVAWAGSASSWGGIAVEIKYLAAAITYNDTPSGGLVLGGSTVYGKTYDDVESGGIALGGSVVQGKVYDSTPSGGIALGGSVVTTGTLTYTSTPSGGLVLGGTTTAFSLCSAGFELGTNGSTILTSDAGNPTPWDNIVIAAGDAITYDNAVARGALCAKITHAVATDSYLNWTTRFGSSADFYGRFYFWLTARPAANSAPGVLLFNSGTAQCGIRHRSDGKLEIINAGNANVATSAMVLPLGQWIRVEFHVINHPSAGSVEAKIFSTNPDGATPDETLTSPAMNSGTVTNDIRFRKGVQSTTAGPTYFDDILAGALSYPGPSGISYASTPSSGIVLGGSVTSDRSFDKTPSGGVVLGGTVAQTRSTDATPSGGIVLGGSVTQSRSTDTTQSGGIVLNGSIITDWSHAGGYSDAPSGGIRLSGSTAISKTDSPAPSGGIALGGSLVVDLSRSFTQTGGIVLGGSVAVTGTLASSVSGGVVLGGSIVSDISRAKAPSAGIILGGSVSLSVSSSRTPSGGVVLNGTCTSSISSVTTYNLFPSGGIILGGAEVSAQVITIFPISDLSDGGWTDQVGGNNLYAAVDEVTVNDADYIKSTSGATTADICELRFPPQLDPVSSTGHILVYRYGSEAEGWTTVTQTLTGPQADAITNYGDLSVKFEAKV